MKKHFSIYLVRKIGLAVCLIAFFALTLSSCQKESNKIVGAWEVVNEDGDLSDAGNIWTFRPDMTFLINDETGSMTGSYRINDNALLLKGDGNVYNAMVMQFDGNFTILKIDKQEMILAGTIKYKEYFDGSYSYYTLSGTTTFSKVK